MPHARTVPANPRLTQPLCENPLAKSRADSDRSRTIFKNTVGKKPKKQQPNGATSNNEAAPPASGVTPSPKKPTKASKTTTRKSSAKKTDAKSGAKKITTRPSTPKSKSYEPSDADVQIRAYFLAEKRLQHKLQGDPSNDWLAARQQLLEEASQSRT